MRIVLFAWVLGLFVLVGCGGNSGGEFLPSNFQGSWLGELDYGGEDTETVLLTVNENGQYTGSAFGVGNYLQGTINDFGSVGGQVYVAPPSTARTAISGTATLSWDGSTLTVQYSYTAGSVPQMRTIVFTRAVPV